MLVMAPNARGDYTVFFDLGGVTCRFFSARRLDALARASGLPPDEVHRRLFAAGAFDEDCDRGQYTLEQQCAGIGARLRVPYDLPYLESLWVHGFEPDAEVLALIDRTRNNATTALLTNNGPLVHAMLLHLLPDVTTHFDHVCFSYQAGAIKPDPRVYLRTLERVGVTRDKSVFVDDAQPNVDGALAVGIDAFRFTSAEDLANQLQARGLV